MKIRNRKTIEYLGLWETLHKPNFKPTEFEGFRNEGNQRDYATINQLICVQNRFHYAITGETVAEIVFQCVDRSKPNIGLTTWKNAPDGRILKSKVIARSFIIKLGHVVPDMV